MNILRSKKLVNLELRNIIGQFFDKLLEHIKIITYKRYCKYKYMNLIIIEELAAINII